VAVNTSHTVLKACEHNIQYTIVVKNQVCTKCGTVAAKHL
jgi:ribosomal protein S27AE